MSPPSDQPSKLPLPPLVSRPATSADLDLLVGMRRTCGWGELDVPDALAAAAAGAEALFVFELGGEPAGMASIVFEGGKEDLTSRETGRMMICESGVLGSLAASCWARRRLTSCATLRPGVVLDACPTCSATLPQPATPRESVREPGALATLHTWALVLSP